MPLHYPGQRREKILVIGPFGGGKSQAWVSIAEFMINTQSPHKMFVLDTEPTGTLDAHAEAVPGFWEKVDARSAYEFGDMVKALDSFRSLATVYDGPRGQKLSDDWLVIDLIDKAWSWSQEYYIEQVFGKHASTFYLEHKQRDPSKSGNPLADAFGMNWQVINKQYAEFMEPILRWPGHVLACSPSEAVKVADQRGQGGEHDPQITAQFGRYGVKPRGQGALGFQFLTVLNMIPYRAPLGDQPGEWRMSSIKDLHREQPQNYPIKNFVVDYLVKIGGWKVA